MTTEIFLPVTVDYDFSKVLATDHRTAPMDSPIPHQKRDLMHIYEPYGGYPDSFVPENTTLYQLWWTKDDLDFELLSKQTGIDIVSISSLMQLPGNTIPLHLDKFYKLKQQQPDRPEPRVRANIFLEDADIGHLLQFIVGDQFVTETAFRANTGYIFDSNNQHLSCNAGMRPKYTLQISGFWQGQEQ